MEEIVGTIWFCISLMETIQIIYGFIIRLIRMFSFCHVESGIVEDCSLHQISMMTIHAWQVILQSDNAILYFK